VSLVAPPAPRRGNTPRLSTFAVDFEQFLFENSIPNLRRYKCFILDGVNAQLAINATHQCIAQKQTTCIAIAAMSKSKLIMNAMMIAASHATAYILNIRYCTLQYIVYTASMQQGELT